MIGAPIGNEYGGCLWTASGDMVCSEKSKLNYYKGAGTAKEEKRNSMSKRTPTGGKKETFKKYVPDSDSDDEETMREPFAQEEENQKGELPLNDGDDNDE